MVYEYKKELLRKLSNENEMRNEETFYPLREYTWVYFGHVRTKIKTSEETVVGQSPTDYENDFHWVLQF